MKKRLLAAGSVAALAIVMPAHADEATGDEQDIVVTAQKREQRLIDVPQSVSVVSGDALENVQATNFSDYLKLVPGLQLNQTTAGFGRLVLRGVNTGGVASTVAVYQDETTFGSSSGLVNGAILAGDFDTFDIERIEVLRGPQGTIYGASSMGGVLKYVTRKPDTSGFEARARGSIETVKGGDESYLGSAVVNMPLGDAVAFRASGFYRDFGGFIDSIGTAGSDVETDINSSKSYGGRASVLFKPSETFSVQLSAYLQNLKTHASNSVDSDPSTGRTLYGRLSQSQFVPEFTDVRYRVYSAVVDADLGFASLVSATSYSSLSQSFRGDLTTQYGALVEGVFGTPNDFYQGQLTRVRRFSQEIRLQSPEDEHFEWLLGAYYTREKGIIDQDFNAVEPGTLTPIDGLPLLGVATIHSRYRELAGFANATLHLGERFDLTFGGRYSGNKQVADQVSDGVLAGGFNKLPEARSSENVFTFSVAPQFEVSDQATIYARVAKGFRPGGPNVLAPGAPPELATYGSDSLISYELGVKAETVDRSFSIDIAAFHIDWKDIQVFGQVNDFGVNFNGGKAKSDGLEFTTTLRPAGGLTVSLNGAYTNARLKDDTPPLVGGLAGDRLPYTPKYSIGANADYEWELGGDATAYVGASVRSLSKQPAGFDLAFRTANGRQRYLPAYEVVDLRAGVDFGKYSLELYAKNLADSEGKTSLEAPANVPLGAAGTAVIRPRTFGVTLTAGF
ncbi:TonB-dependent receptor [Sphingopyxis sp. GW247-27LB]|uniref:TonB-dependent receptor n=1 Tax=Sphingopyxis sp. GW247-27LB TaxID=2012632 RepID=UPI000BA57805|nr:TonB-dependent receptor [Sphingopyxis sp. GW247-27LB]PAL25560.1 TonB-dependent receptor [Sphingopyxis sp. GW247-27LB]